MKRMNGLLWFGLFVMQICGGSTLVAASAIDGRADEWSTLSAKLASYRSVYKGEIASLKTVNTIPDAPLCGGGKLTVALDGTHREVNYHLSKSDFWALELHPGRLFQKHHIRQVPLGRVAMTVHNAARRPNGLRHVQDMATADIRSDVPLDGGTLKVRCLALAQRDMVVYELEASGTTAALTVRLVTEDEKNNFFIISGVHDDETVWVRKEHTSFITVNAASALRVVGGANVRASTDTRLSSAVSLDVQPGIPVRLLLCVKGGKDEYRCLDKALAELDAAKGDAIAKLLAEHAEWWKAYWLKSWIDVDNELLERYYFGSLYVLGSTIDLDARVMPGLAGGWITAPNPIWGGTYTMNYNGEAPFWSLFSANRGEFILPYARVLQDYIPTGRALAKRIGTKGIVLPVMMGPWGIEDNDDALGQKSNASLAAMSLIWHCRFSRDREFIEQYAYPYIRELMDFWEDNLVMGETGKYVIHGAARERDWGDLNPGPTLGYVREVIKAAIELSTELGVDEARRPRWHDYLARLSDCPAMVVEGNLCFVEAENRHEITILGEPGTLGVGDNPVVLDSVYPGGVLDDDENDRGRIIARNTLRYLQSWNQANGFPRIFSQAVRAEYPGEELLEIFTKRLTHGEGPHELLRENNTFISDDHSFEGVGCIEFINSMLAHAHGGVLKVFDVWPEGRDASFEQLRVRGAFLVSGELKDGNVTRVEVVSEKGGACSMESCWPGRGIQVCEVGGSGEPTPPLGDSGHPSQEGIVECALEKGVYTWDTEPGATYVVSAGDAVSVEKVNPPEMLVPIVDPAAAQGRKYTNARLDVLLTPELKTTALQIDLVRRDESRIRCTAHCRFTSRDASIASVDANGTISAVGRGRTVIDVEATIDGVQMACALHTYVLTANVIPGVTAASTSNHKGWTNRGWKNRPECLVGGGGSDGPDVTSLHRSNSYEVGMYVMQKGGEQGTLLFDFGREYALDEMYVWNFNCPNDYRVLWWSGGTPSGLRDVAIETSVDGSKWTPLKDGAYPFRLAKATGKQWMPATNLDDGKNSPIRFGGIKARYVRLIPEPTVGVGNWGGTRFGLSEVRFTYIKEGGE